MHIIVIGAGFSGLSAACHLAKVGYQVTILEKNDGPGGRARQFEADGFTFDMGPSWYWMPDVFEDFFGAFDKKPSDYYRLKRLDPAYQIVFSPDSILEMPAGRAEQKAVFESIEQGSGAKLDAFLKEAAYKYKVGMKEFVYKPSLSFTEYLDPKLLGSAFHLDMFRSISTHVRKYFHDPKLVQAVEFPVLFLGAAPDKTPALYSMMNYADMELGTWYPMGGMHKIIEGMESLAISLGVDIRYDAEVRSFDIRDNRIRATKTNGLDYSCDLVVASADYHHVEQRLLARPYRQYDEHYWEKRVMAPSSLLFYLGVDRRLPRLKHHNLFFDAPFVKHVDAIYEEKEWPNEPLFYVCAPSKTDSSVAPDGMENLFVLVPLAAGLEDGWGKRDDIYRRIMDRLGSFTGIEIQKHIIFNRSYAMNDFKADYHAFKGNAYGLANTIRQTAFLKPRMRSKKVPNLFYAGQLTVPGPGMPPSLISGEVVAKLIQDKYPTEHEYENAKIVQ